MCVACLAGSWQTTPVSGERRLSFPYLPLSNCQAAELVVIRAALVSMSQLNATDLFAPSLSKSEQTSGPGWRSLEPFLPYSCHNYSIVTNSLPAFLPAGLSIAILIGTCLWDRASTSSPTPQASGPSQSPLACQPARPTAC